MEASKDFVLERLNAHQNIILNQAGRSYTCGRGKENEIVCLSLVVSRRHCIFFHGTNDLYVTDLQSSNGIFINGTAQRPYQMIKLRENDIVGIGCSDIHPKEITLFAYRVCVVKSRLSTKEIDTSLSKTVLNDEAPKKCISPIGRALGTKCGVDQTHCDIDVPYKISKYIDKDEHELNINIAEDKEINYNTCGKQNPRNNDINSIITNNDVEEITKEDDIKIIHTSLTRKTKKQNTKNCNLKATKYLKNDNELGINHKTTAIKPCKNPKSNEKQDISFDKDDKRGNSDSKGVHKMDISKNMLNVIDTTNHLNVPREPKLVYNNEQIIKLEDELQITDDDEDAHLAAINNSASSQKSPIKLKRIKQEPKTRFSEIDVVDLSDDDDGIFPYSQLFDIKFGETTATNNKKIVKQECADNDTEKTNLLDIDDEVIILTDSEDEDNPWLERLSRSQVLNEDKNVERCFGEILIKDEVDLGIWEDDILTIIGSKTSCVSEIRNSKKVISELNISLENKTGPNYTTIPTCSKVQVETKSIDKIDLCNKISLTDADCANIPKGQTDAEDKDLHKLHKKPDDFYNASSSNNMKQRLTITTSKRLIPVIEAPFLPPKKSRSESYKNKSPKHSEKKSSAKQKSKLTHEKEMLQLKEKLDHSSLEKKNHRTSHKKIGSSSLSNGKRMCISKEEKKLIIEGRKAKLKKIAVEEKKCSTEDDQNIKRGTAKPKAKVSLKNRGDFLINEHKSYLPNTYSSKSEELSSSSNVSYKQLKDNISKKIAASVTETKGSCQEENTCTDAVNNVVTALQQSLHLNNIIDTTKVSKQDSGKDHNMPGDLRKKLSSHSNRGKKKSSPAIEDTNTIDTNVKTHDLRDKSTERSSVSVQKENCSPNLVKSKRMAGFKRRVTFVEKPEIREYEIDPQNTLHRLVGKDAPIPTNKLTKTSTTYSEWSPKVEEFLSRIFMWNPVWLEEQRYLKREPPIVSENEVQPMVSSYESFQHYYKVAMPLLLLEIWCTMTKEFETIEKSMQRLTKMCSIIENSITRTPIPSTNQFLTTLMFEILIKKEDFDRRNHPTYGDLVSFEYMKNVNGKQTFHKVFAYITSMYHTIITDFTHYNKDLRNYVENPYAVITFTILTRPLEHNIPMKRVQRVRTIAYLRSTMRMVQALQYLPQSPLMKPILNPKIEDYQLPLISKPYPSLITKDKLNARQLEAVFRVTETVLKKEPKICFIQGPPGTGKSKVIVNLITQILYSDQDNRNNKKSLRILLCAPSNAAVDELVIRLLNIRSNIKHKRFNMIRIGRSETMHPVAKAISVTELAKRHLKITTEKAVFSAANGLSSIEEDKAILEARINSLREQLTNSQIIDDAKRKYLKRKLADATTKYELLKCGKSIDELNPKDRAKFQRISEDMFLSGADIITCTLSSCYTNHMESIFGGNKERISVCIVDEATQSCEAETLIPLMLGVNTLVLVGDPNQLPATILSQQAKRLGLDQSIFSRIQNEFKSQPNNPIIMLDTQYRMTYGISYWPNKYFYGGKLKNEVVTNLTFPYHAYRVLNHNSAQDDDKFSNTNEAEFIANMIFVMLMFVKWENTTSSISLGVLTPYNNQRNMVQNKINEKLSSVPDNLKKRIDIEVNTVDSFQGQERDVIIMSCVRSNGIGFLSDRQRLCVALTRAKHSLILCGNFNTFMKDPMWNSLLSDARSRGILCNINTNATPTIIKSFIIK